MLVKWLTSRLKNDIIKKMNATEIKTEGGEKMAKAESLEILKESDFRRELKSEPRAGYLFFGDEDYLKAHAVRQARELVCSDPTLAFFNDMRLDAIDFTPQKLIDALTPMPMMADRKLITLSGMNFSSMRSHDLDDFCEALAELNNFDYNLLIISVASDCLDTGYLPKKPSESLKKLAEHLTPVQFDRCSTAKLTAWIAKHFEHNGVQATPDLCAQMPEYCGHSMFLLANEIDKLSYYTLSHGKISPTLDDMRLVCSSEEEYDTFAFTNAIMENRTEAALAILADYRFRRVDPLFILSDVMRVICEMLAVQALTAEGLPAARIGATFKPAIHEFRIGLYQKSLRNTSEQRLRLALAACNAADTTFKSSPQNGYTVLEQLICSL